MDSVTLTVDNAEFFEALNDIIRLSSRELPEVIDGTARDLCFAARAKTKQAATSKIERLRGKPIMHALATKEGFPKGKGNADRMNHIVNRRLSAIKYSKLIWLKIAKDLGARISTEMRKISHAHGIRAEQSVRPVAYLRVDGLPAKHVARIMQPALDTAVGMTAKKMRDRVNRKLAEIAARKSGRR